jgi:hypothetical protein
MCHAETLCLVSFKACTRQGISFKACARHEHASRADLADCGDNNKTQTMTDFLKEHVPEALVDRIEDEDPSPTDEEAQAKAEL